MIAYLVVAAVLAVAGAVLARRAAVARKAALATRGRIEAETIVEAARAEIAARAAAAEAEAAERALALKRAAQEEASQRERELARRDDELRRLEAGLAAAEQALIARRAALGEREGAVGQLDQRRRGIEDEAKRVGDEARVILEGLAGDTRDELKTRLVAEWVDDARASAADRIRRVEQGLNDVEHGREAKRIMGIAIQRYEGHYLTERLLSNLPLLPDAVPRIFGPALEHLPVIEELANIKLTLADDQMAVRLEGQDSFGREIARRAISRFGKHGGPKGGDARAALTQIKAELEREVVDLGRRAFKELEIPRAHPEIVELVGRLNWRTSYTQNQWKHAVEAAFLCGMMASELGLDVKLARRAALMHDIGKALTHAIDGSHAVIGADYARRLGEAEVVANAIGAHHLEEPFNSVYASLVAAADALSGARPGARREQNESYGQRLDDLERIGGRFAGVERAFAVQGGREVRVYVKEERVSDERAVELSSEIARQISDELTFPGQIKVTVIREMRATAVAG